MKRKNSKKINVFAGAIICFIIVIGMALGVKYSKDIGTTESNTGSSSSIPANCMQMHVIDVGQGDSILLTQDGHNILIDAGPGESQDDLISYLDRLGIKEFEYVIATHPHADHIGGMDKIAENYKIDNFIMSDLPMNMIPTTKAYEKMIDILTEKNINVIMATPGSKYKSGEIQLEILAPLSMNYDDLNDFSVITMASFKGKRILLTGDASKGVEKELISNGIDLSCDIYKVGHHGSDDATSKKLLYAMSAKHAAICAGIDNSYNHPSEKTIEKLDEYNLETYVTKDSGTIVFTLTQNDISVKTEK